MKIAYSVLLAVLTALAVASGVAKIALTPNDVEFFGRHGFSDPLLIAFGAFQLAGGILMPWKKTRFIGAAAVALTFLVSLAILIMDGNIRVGIVTAVATLLLLVVMKLSWTSSAKSVDGVD